MIKLINIILNDYQIYPNYFHFFTIQNIYRTLIGESSKKITNEKNNEKKNEYLKIKYIFDGNKQDFQCKYKEKIKDINKKNWSKINQKNKKVIFFYNGIELDEELTIEEIINEKDKQNNQIVIHLFEVCDINAIKIKEVSCPECSGNIFINFSNYKINLENCQKGHMKKNISLNDFMKTQKRDSHLKCDICNKHLISQNSFYKCFSCNKDLCQNCNEKHDKAHNIFDCKEINNICNIHYGIYYKY